MNVQNPNRVVTKQDLRDFYDGIYPYLNSAVNAGFTPVGTIIAVMGNSAPANYLACNGQIVNIATYPELAGYFEQQFGNKNKFGGNGTTTFGIPDLRGEFLRGTGTNSHANQGNGAAVGTHQDATYQPNVMCGDKTISGVKTDLDTANNNSIREQDKNVTRIPSGIISGQTQTITKYTVSNASTGATSSTETGFYARPTNTSVLYCIAVKNIYLNPNLQYNYSTDEQIIGVWIDGKPLYQKTFSATATTYTENGNRRIFNVTLDNSINIKNGFGIITITNASITAYIGVELYVGSTAFATDLSAQYTVQIGKFKTGQGGTFNNSLVFACELSIGVSSFDYIVTVQYTKTTD